MSLITKMDSPKRFKENVEPYALSRTRYEKIVEDLKALGLQHSTSTRM